MQRKTAKRILILTWTAPFWLFFGFIFVALFVALFAAVLP